MPIGNKVRQGIEDDDKFETHAEASRVRSVVRQLLI